MALPSHTSSSKPDSRDAYEASSSTPGGNSRHRSMYPVHHDLEASLLVVEVRGEGEEARRC